MGFIRVLMFLSVVQMIKAQNSFQLQFIGEEISQEEQTKLNLCDSKYCLWDANLLFTSATQNESVTPCEDIKEFAVGTLDKYSVVSDRENGAGFFYDLYESYNQRLKKILSAKINDKDTRVTKAMKKLYKKCVSSDYVRKFAVEEMRDYLRTYGLKFYPEENDESFDITKFMEEQSHVALNVLFNVGLRKYQNSKKNCRVEVFTSGYRHNGESKEFFSSFEELLYEMFQIHRNGSNIDKFKSDFKEIAENLHANRRVYDWTSDWAKPSLMSIEEMNNSTSLLNIDWSRIINNRLRNKLRDGEKICVESPHNLRYSAEYLASIDKRVLADSLVYHFLFKHAELVTVYQNDYVHTAYLLSKRSKERWFQCMQMFHGFMNPALEFLYSLKFNNEKQREGMEKFLDEARNFFVSKIKSEVGKSIDATEAEDLINVVNARKVILGYPKEFLEPKKIEEFYSEWLLSDEQKFVNMSLEVEANYEKLKLDPIESELGKFTDQRREERVQISNDDHTFSYINDGDIFIHHRYMQYPFYHYQRPRFFNSATVAKFFFYKLVDYSTGNFQGDVFHNLFQLAYEFYDEWLKAGNKDLQIGAHRMTDRQLYWLAAARVHYTKDHEGSDINHVFTFGFQPDGITEAFHCKFNIYHWNLNAEWVQESMSNEQVE